MYGGLSLSANDVLMWLWRPGGRTTAAAAWLAQLSENGVVAWLAAAIVAAAAWRGWLGAAAWLA